MGVFGDHDCESTLFWLILRLEVKSCVWKGCILEHHAGVKRVECRWAEVDYGYLAALGVKRVWWGNCAKTHLGYLEKLRIEPVCTVFGLLNPWELNLNLKQNNREYWPLKLFFILVLINEIYCSHTHKIIRGASESDDKIMSIYCCVWWEIKLLAIFHLWGVSSFITYNWYLIFRLNIS